MQAAAQKRPLQRALQRVGVSGSGARTLDPPPLRAICPSGGAKTGPGGAESGKWVALWEKVGYSGARMVMHGGTRVAGLLPPSHPGSKFGQANENP
jgi:hypothetical protein